MIELGIKRPITTLMLVVAIVVFAVVSFPRIPLELYPNLETGEISVITRLRGGIPATEVEKGVTHPMEEVFSEVNGLKELTSASRESESVIVLRFHPGTNLNFATLDVREKLATIRHRLPREVEKPVIAKFQQFDTPILIIALSSESLSPERLRERAEEKIKERIMRINGVANIEIGGGQERKILIDIDNARLLAYSLPIMSVVEMINVNNISVSAGNVEKMGERYIVRATGEYSAVKEIENTGIGVTPQGSIIRLSDIATVRDSYYEPSSFARLNVKPVVSMYIQKESEANTITVGNKISSLVEELSNQYASDMTMTIVKNDAEFIQKAITSLKISVFEGAILVTAILFFFLRNFKTIGIIVTTLPISLLLSAVLMYFGGLSLNIMTLSGLAMGLGNLMDNAIVIMGNLSYHSKRSPGMDRETMVVKGTSELMMPIIASTLSTIIVFLPLVFLDPEIKRMYVPFGLAIGISLCASLFGTLIFVPPLCVRVKGAFDFETPRWYVVIEKMYTKALKSVFRRQRLFIAGTILLFIASIFIFMTRDSEFAEAGEANTFRIGIQFPPGMRIERSDDIVKKIEKTLLSYPSVDRISSRVEKLHTFIEVKMKQDKKKVMDEFRARFNEFSPAFIYYQESQDIASREVYVDFYGYDYAVLKQIAFAASGRLSQVRGLSDIKIRMREDEPEINVVASQNRLSLFGITTLYMANTLHNQLRGLVATHYRSEGKEIETIARLTPGTVRSSHELPFLRFVTPSGQVVALNQVGDISQVTTAQEIWHKNKKRFIQISANRNKLGLTAAVSKMRQVLSGINFPKDYTYNFSGDYEKTMQNRKDFSLALVLTIILIYLNLASLYESYSQPLLIMLALPLSSIGVAFTLAILRKPISLGVWIGMMILGGTVVNASILLVERINLSRAEKKRTLRAIMESCRERLRPVLMTSLNNIVGLIPLVLSRDEAAGMWRSLGLTVMGGMFSGTLLTLFVIPVSYLIMESFYLNRKTIVPSTIAGIRNSLPAFIRLLSHVRLKNLKKFKPAVARLLPKLKSGFHIKIKWPLKRTYP
ncbi:MAG: hypothetical protein A2219_00805 [Elusimicrobia bacterium RIFOXYA2_FULL_50_26]|nr:MAG: hypothetical protein A2219_00805 [Elusimicrobia bacterium RIFOXYA2_FULL_50_26]